MSFLCPICGNKFCNKQSYSRHWNNIHNGKSQFNCSLCEKQFRRKDNLQNHFVRVHRPDKKDFYRKKCEYCHKTVDRQKYKRHLMLKHRPIIDKIDDRPRMNCSLCSASFLYKSSLRNHKKKVHNLAAKKLSTIKCPLCSYLSNTGSISSIYSHFKWEHKIAVKFETFLFRSVEEFYKWKRDIEKQTVSSFRTNRKELNVLRFKCHRSGRYRSMVSQRNLKITGSCKINGFCPAFIHVNILNDCVKVTYQPTHVGHKNELRYISLTTEERKAIALQLAKKVPSDEILKRIRGSLTNTPLQRIHLTNKKDIYNIKHSFDLDAIAAECSNDPNVEVIERQVFSSVDNVDNCKQLDIKETVDHDVDNIEIAVDHLVNFTEEIVYVSVDNTKERTDNEETDDYPVDNIEEMDDPLDNIEEKYYPVDSTEEKIGHPIDNIEETVDHLNDNTEKTVDHGVNITEETVEYSVNITEESVYYFVDNIEETVDHSTDDTEETVDNIEESVQYFNDNIEKEVGHTVNITEVDNHINTEEEIGNISFPVEISLNDKPVCPVNGESQLDILVDSLRTLQSTSLVVYKPKGRLDPDFPDLEKNDFLLIYMTEKQKDILIRDGNDIVCIDGTDCPNINLYALLTPDETGEGFPVVFMFTNRRDELVMSVLFEKIKDVVGYVRPVVFMTDTEGKFNASWNNVMGGVGLHMYSSSKVLKAWRINVNKIKLKEKQNKVFKSLQALLYELDKSRFHNMLEDELINWNEDEELSVFHEHFYESFVGENKFKKWAYCYRLDCDRNVNLSLDIFNRVLQYCNLRGEKIKQMDKRLLDVLNLLRDRIFDLITKITKGKIAKKLQNLRLRHGYSYINESEYVIQEEDKWLVLNYSRNEVGEMYNVRKVKECNACSLQCLHCNSCFHEYVCSCSDHLVKNNMCKHVHLVARTQKLVEGNSDESQNSVEVFTPEESDVITKSLLTGQ